TRSRTSAIPPRFRWRSRSPGILASRSRRCSMTKDRSRGITRSKWFLPSFSLVLGLVILAAAWLGGQPGEGVFGLVGLTVFGLIFLLAGRSEAIRGLRGDAATSASRRSTCGRPRSPAGPARRADRRPARGHRPGPERQSVRLAPRYWRAGLP